MVWTVIKLNAIQWTELSLTGRDFRDKLNIIVRQLDHIEWREDMFDRDDLLSSVAQPPLSDQNLDPDSINFWIKSSTVLLTRVRCQWQ